MKSSFVLRTRILCGVFVFATALIITRLYFVQIVRGDVYRNDAKSQYVAASPDTGERGSIFFTAKDGTLISGALMQTGWQIAIVPKDITDIAQTYDALNAIIAIDRERFFSKVGKTDDPYEEIVRRVPDNAADKVRVAHMPGVLLVADQWRFYPARESAAQTIGFVGYSASSSEKKVGVYGLERSYESTLAKSGSGLYVNPFAEIFTNLEAALARDPASHEGSLITSIEPSVEAQLEKTLDGVMVTYTPRIAGGIVMDPHTGAIIAIAARPSFDPNTYNLADPATFANPLVENIYDMGSIMKPLTMAAGIDAGAVRPKTKYNDTGCIEKSGKKICNYDQKARGVVDMQEVLNQSLNLGASFVVDTMGHEVFGRYVNAYGLGTRTGIDLPNEAIGQIGAINDGYDVDYAAAAFGQGISVSAVEMTRALAALANAGVLPNPRVVKAIKYESGITRSIDPGLGPRVLSTTTVETVTDMLVKVFDTALLHGALRQEHYSIAAKTGTAQIAMPGGGGYYADRYVHSFFGYLPAHESKFIVFLYAVEPHGAEFASATLARPFLDIAQFLINYYDIPPDR